MFYSPSKISHWLPNLDSRMVQRSAALIRKWDAISALSGYCKDIPMWQSRGPTAYILAEAYIHEGFKGLLVKSRDSTPPSKICGKCLECLYKVAICRRLPEAQCHTAPSRHRRKGRLTASTKFKTIALAFRDYSERLVLAICS